LAFLTFSLLVARDTRGERFPPVVIVPGCRQAAATNGTVTRFVSIADPALGQAVKRAGAHRAGH
jgi:hypothetical protein